MEGRGWGGGGVSKPTLVSGDGGDILGGWGHTQYLVAINLPLNLRQVSKGAGDACRKVWNMADLQQQLHTNNSNRSE